MKIQMSIKSFSRLKNLLCATAFAILSIGQLAAQDGDAANGEAIFKGNCKTCHAPTADKVIGPGLKDISKRRPVEWLVKWVKNPMSVVNSGDEYAVKLYNDYNKIQMTGFPAYGEKEIKDILAYIEKANVPVTLPGGNTPPTQTSGSSDLFTYILVALLFVMVLVLGVLLLVLGLLRKKSDEAAGVATSSTSFVDNISNTFKSLTQNKAVRSATLWFFALMIIKASIDGLYGVGLQQGYAPKQPINFSHKLHAGQYQIDCNYCHTGVNRGKSATIPSANICMNCHGEIKKGSPEIQKIYKAIEQDKPVEWVRVHNLPDLAYFNHAQHVNVGGVQCEQCHGDVKGMEVIQQKSSLTMGWCIDCHRQTDVNTKGNGYYDKLVEVHNKGHKQPLKVADIGGLECSKCHY
jgi:mono/diheme cytochrome c family protein